ncbi:zinc finger X-chromosomal protein [Fusarium oxysporum]|nr:zinc finger X-chromosomal protein [Fusarium oxysporum]
MLSLPWAQFQHINAVNHFSCRCSLSDETWPSEQQRNRHGQRDHYYCKDANGLMYHLERGSCPKAAGLNRDTLYKFVRSKDPGGPSPIISSVWECYLCHRLFGSLNGLNQHLNSPVYQGKSYHCPKRDCRKEFTTLTPIINHLDGEACGCTRFGNAQQGTRSMISGNRRIGF